METREHDGYISLPISISRKILPLVSVAVGMVLSSCSKEKRTLGPPTPQNVAETPLYENDNPRVTYKLNRGFGPNSVEHLEITLPKGDFIIIVSEIKLNGSEGTDSIKGSSILLSESVSSNGDGKTISILENGFKADRTVMSISGNHNGKQISKIIFFNADLDNGTEVFKTDNGH